MAETTLRRRPILPQYALPKCGLISPLEFDAFEHLDPDWRGLVKLWEPPQPKARYVMGIDPAGGIVNWSRHRRVNDDLEHDNSAIEVIKCGNGRDIADIQVAEFAAPMMAQDIVEVATLLGRLYCGNSDVGEALCIIETWPGPGMLTHQDMVARHGYVNMWRWEYLDTLIPTVANTFGWKSNMKTLDYLWNKFSRHVGKGLLKVRSGELFSELSNLQTDPKKTFPQPCTGQVHDDRVRAIATAVWAAHDWVLGDEGIPERQKVNDPAYELNPQACDMTVEGYDDWAERKYQEIIGNG